MTIPTLLCHPFVPSLLFPEQAPADFLLFRRTTQHFWRERATFAVSTAILFTLAQEDEQLVRGMVGRTLRFVLR